MARGFGLGENLVDRLDELARRVGRELDRDARAGPLALIDEVDVERMLIARMIRVIIRDVELPHFEPVVAAFAAGFEGNLLGDHRAHFSISSKSVAPAAGPPRAQ